MQPGPNNDDLHRYIESLQRQLMTPGWEDFFDPQLMKAWLVKNGDKLNVYSASQYDGTTSPAARLEELVNSFQPKTAFDSPQTQAIFEPILEEVKRAAKDMNIQVQRPIQIVTSTSAGVSPATRPTGGNAPHFLFVGLGTSSFCNYWAKAFTAIVKALAKPNPSRRFTQAEEVEAVLKSDPSGVVLAGRLALAYGVYGSLIGFGQVNEPADYWPYREQVLNSMEVFVVAHEFAHLIADEQLPQFSGLLDAVTSRKLEYFCDELALQISRRYANHADNLLSFVGLGGVLLFRAMELSEYALARISAMNGRPKVVSTALRRSALEDSAYPTLTERIDRIKFLAVSTTPDDQRQLVVDFVMEYDLIATYLVHFLQEILGTLEL
jgi:hypothetical protein